MPSIEYDRSTSSRRIFSTLIVVTLLSLLLGSEDARATDLLWAPPEVDGGSVDSASALEQALISRDRDVHRVTSLTGQDLAEYEAVFVCLGVYPHTRPLTLSEGHQLLLYLQGGGALFIEGGDIWGYDILTPLNTIDGISASADGGSDLYTIVSKTQIDSPFSGLSADYFGEKSALDHIYADEPGARAVLSHSSGNYHVGILHHGELSGFAPFRLVGFSFEFGGWAGDHQELVEAILISLELEAGCNIQPPTTPRCLQENQGVYLSWQNLDVYSSIELFRNELLIATLPFPTSSHFDPLPGAGVHVYHCRVSSGPDCSASSGSCTEEISSAPTFRRGDLNGTLTLDVSDVIRLLLALFQPGSDLPCPDAGDANDSGRLEIGDALTMLLRIFDGGAPLPAPGLENCGSDPTADNLENCSPTCTP